MISPEETKYCLDSSFIIDLLNGFDTAVKVYEEIKDARLTVTAIASVVLFEILRGEEENQDKIQRFEELRKKMIVLPFGEREAEEASKEEKAINLNKQKISPMDLLIGVTAKTNSAILITKNIKDFQKIDGLDLKSY